jgi:hypothetical protein
MANLSAKILSYPVETYIPMHSAVGVTTPEMYGTYLPTATPYMNTSSTIPTYDPTSSPVGATGGSWLFNQPTTGQGRQIRMNSATYLNEKVWDGRYGFGIWVKFNSLPTGTGQYTVFSTARSSSFPGFSLNISGNGYPTYPRTLISNLFGTNLILTQNVQINTWYYIVGRKSIGTGLATMWVNGVKLQTGTNNTTGTTPIAVPGESQYTITFGSQQTASTSNSFSFNLAHAHLMDYTNFTDAAIADIYQAGSTSSRTVKYFNGTSWVDSIGQKVWNGTAWVDWNAKRFDGSTWVTI